MTKQISKIHQRVQEAQRLRTSHTSRKINDMVANDMLIDRSGDVDFLSKNNQTWSELNDLREALAKATMEFTGQVYALIQNPEVQACLGEKRGKFDKLVATFFSDGKYFSERVAKLRAQHEHRTEKFATMEEYGEFQKLALEYQNAQDELNTLFAPTISEIVLIVHEQTSAALKAANDQANLTDPKVVSDVEIKQ